MEKLAEVSLNKLNILSILDSYYKLFPLIYISYDPDGITIQGSCETQRILRTKVIPRDSFDSFECKQSMVLTVPYHLRSPGGRCVSIEVLKIDSYEIFIHKEIPIV